MSTYSGKSAMLVMPARPSFKGVRSFEIGSYLLIGPDLLVTAVLSAQVSRI